MLRKETVSPDLIYVLEKLMHFKSLREFRLVGGTALAFQLGHRVSVDIDLFASSPFDIEEVKKEIEDTFLISTAEKESRWGLRYWIKGVKAEMYNWDIPFIKPSIIENGIRMTSLEDIGAMKLDAIKSRHEKKDFVDIHEILKSFSLEELFQFYSTKYRNPELRSVIEALTNIDKADNSIDPEILIDMQWVDVKSTIKNALKKFIDSDRKK